MIRQLMKRDPAWRWTPYFSLGGGAVCLLWHLLVVRTGADTRLAFLGAFFLLPFMAAYAATIQQGDTRFQATLPVTVRQVYLSRVLSMIGLLWPPIAVAAAVALALPNPAPPISTLLGCMSVFTLAMVALQSASIRGFAIPLPVIFVLGFGSTSFAAVRDTPPFVTPICWLALAVVFIGTWRTLPKSFQSAPMKALSVAKRGARVSGSRTPAIPWIPVLRTVLRWGGLEILYVFVLAAAGSIRPYLVMLFVQAWLLARPRVRWLFALPIHRRALLAAILVPAFLAFAGGYLVNFNLEWFPGPYSERGIRVRASQELPEWSLTHQYADCRTLNVLPPVNFWALAKRGKAPLIQAPWGETFQPPVFRRAGFDIFNPYAVGCGNSERFLDWQFNRATIAVHGKPFPRDKDPGWLDSHVVVTSPRTQFVTIAFFTEFAMFAMIVVLLNDWHGFRRLPGPVRVTTMCVAGVVGFAVLILDSWNKLALSEWAVWALPPSFAGAAAVAIPILAILYWALDSLFRQVELVDKPGVRPA